MDSGRLPKWTAAYLWLQAAAVAAWWALLIIWPTSRQLFFLPGDVTWPFLSADLATYVALGSVAACSAQRRSTWAAPSMWTVFGASIYATVFTIGYGFRSGLWLGVLLMVPPLLMTGYLCLRSLR